MACVAHLGEVEKIREQLLAKSTGLLVVSQAQPAVLASFLRRYPKPYPVVCDPSRSHYQAFGLERTSWLTIFRPDVMFGYLKRMALGTRARIPYQGEDVLQLGGDFILNRNRDVLYAHPSAVPTDRPSTESLLQAASTGV